MKLSVNGKEQILDREEIALTELLKENNVPKPELVSIQLNGFFVKREAYHQTIVKENDEVDFVFFMGGGSLLTGKF